MQNYILRLPAIKARTGLSRSTIYLHIAQGLYPKFVKLGARASGLPESEVEAIKAARISGKTDDEIRQLVIELEAARKVLTPKVGA